MASEYWFPTEWQRQVLAYLNEELVPSWFNAPRHRYGLTTVLARWICAYLREHPGRFLLLVCTDPRELNDVIHSIQRSIQRGYEIRHYTDATRTTRIWFTCGVIKWPRASMQADVVVTIHYNSDVLFHSHLPAIPGPHIVQVKKLTDVTETRAAYAKELDPHLPPDLARIIVDKCLGEPAAPLASWFVRQRTPEGMTLADKLCIEYV